MTTTTELPHIRAKTYRARRTTHNWTVARQLDAAPRTVCGAPVTDRDLTLRDATTKAGLEWPVCPACRAATETNR